MSAAGMGAAGMRAAPPAAATTRFEGSYRPDALSPRAVMECRICWTPYDPAVGDETRSILPGTPFTALPDDWKCPNCDGLKDQFMVLDDPGLAFDPVARGAALAAAFREIHAAKMRDVPFTNRALSVEAVGFRDWQGMALGVLVTPWMMALALLPGPDAPWPPRRAGTEVLHPFPSGDYGFLQAERPDCGAYATCALFADMGTFGSQLQAVDTARAVMVQLFRAENREDTDRSADIRAAAEVAAEAGAAAETPAEAIAPDPAPTRRRLVTGGLAG